MLRQSAVKILVFFCTYFYLLHASSANDNVTMLKDYIANEYKRIYPDLTIQSVSLIARDTLDIYAITIISQHLNTTKGANGYLTLQYRHGSKVIQDSIRYSISGYIQIHTATENIRAGSNIDANSFVSKMQDFSTLANIPASKTEILQSSAKMYIPARTIIYRNKLAQRVLVTKDSNVKIIFSNYGIEASASGRALENGAQGDIIKVENLDSKRIIKAKVTAENIVRIH